MDRISTSTAVAQMPAVTDDGTPGFFTGGNPSAGTPATFVSADFLNGMQEELVGVITAAGLTPSKTNLTQLLAAMKKLFVRLGSDADAALGIGLDATDGLPHAYASGVDRGAFCLMSAFAGGLAARGETGTWVLPDGHIMQVFPTPTFTIEQANTPQPYKFTYPTAFPNFCSYISASDGGSGLINWGSFITSGNTGGTGYAWSLNAGTIATGFCLAIGK